MPRWMWFGPIGLLGLFLAFHAYKLGTERAAVTETVVIDYYAERYLADHQRAFGEPGRLTDCIGLPGEMAGIWIEVRCSPANGSADFIYGADRSGTQVYAGRAGETPRT